MVERCPSRHLCAFMEKTAERASFKEGTAAIWNQIRPFKKEVGVLVILGLISAAANGSVPYITGRFFDALIQISQGHTDGSGFPVWATLLAVWAAVQLVANNIDWIIDRMRRSIDIDIHMSVQAQGFIHLILLPIGFHKNERINEIFERFSVASWRIASVFRTAVNFAPQLLSVGVGIALAYTIDQLLASVLLVGVAFYSALLLIMIRPVAKKD